MEILHYKGWHGCKSKCGIEVIREGDEIIVKVIELASNEGTSATNAIEEIATILYRDRFKDIPSKNIIWILEQRGLELARNAPLLKVDFEVLASRWNRNRFDNPRWTPVINIEEAKELQRKKAMQRITIKERLRRVSVDWRWKFFFNILLPLFLFFLGVVALLGMEYAVHQNPCPPPAKQVEELLLKFKGGTK